MNLDELTEASKVILETLPEAFETVGDALASLPVRRLDGGKFEFRCPYADCDTRTTGPPDIVKFAMRRHLERVHRVCSLCGGSGEIRAIPNPLTCPNCGGGGE